MQPWASMGPARLIKPQEIPVMCSAPVPGTEGYAEDAERLVEAYEKVSFADLHGPVLHLLPGGPGRVLDIGSGTGRDAAAFAARGHHVVAVEPVSELRKKAETFHPSPRIEWLNDSLPELSQLTDRSMHYDVIMLTGVWMHLDEQERRRAMGTVASLARPGAHIIFRLRYGPAPAGRRIFDVPAQETIDLAHTEGLTLVLRQEDEAPLLGSQGVRWTRLAFVKSADDC